VQSQPRAAVLQPINLLIRGRGLRGQHRVLPVRRTPPVPGRSGHAGRAVQADKVFQRKKGGDCSPPFFLLFSIVLILSLDVQSEFRLSRRFGDSRGNLQSAMNLITLFPQQPASLSPLKVLRRLPCDYVIPVSKTG
jgi:hypothetical protein